MSSNLKLPVDLLMSVEIREKVLKSVQHHYTYSHEEFKEDTAPPIFDNMLTNITTDSLNKYIYIYIYILYPTAYDDGKPNHFAAGG